MTALPWTGVIVEVPDRADSMTGWRKSLEKLLVPGRERSIDFDELCAVLVRLGFEHRRTTGSHRIYVRSDMAEIVNIQPRRDGTAKPYQVRQIRDLILQYRLDRLDPEVE